MGNGKSILLLILVAVVIIGGAMWYLGRGGVVNERPIEDENASLLLPAAVTTDAS